MWGSYRERPGHFARDVQKVGGIAPKFATVNFREFIF
jgi:hypothetical protein